MLEKLPITHAWPSALPMIAAVGLVCFAGQQTARAEDVRPTIEMPSATPPMVERDSQAARELHGDAAALIQQGEQAALEYGLEQNIQRQRDGMRPQVKEILSASAQPGVLIRATVGVRSNGEKTLLDDPLVVIGAGSDPKSALVTYLKGRRNEVVDKRPPDGFIVDYTASRYIWATKKDGAITFKDEIPQAYGPLNRDAQFVVDNDKIDRTAAAESAIRTYAASYQVLEQRRLPEETLAAVKKLTDAFNVAEEQRKQTDAELATALRRAKAASEASTVISLVGAGLSIATTVSMADAIAGTSHANAASFAELKDMLARESEFAQGAMAAAQKAAATARSTLTIQSTTVNQLFLSHDIPAAALPAL